MTPALTEQENRNVRRLIVGLKKTHGHGSQNKLAPLLDVHPGALSQLLTGKTGASLALAQRVARLAGVDIYTVLVDRAAFAAASPGALPKVDRSNPLVRMATRFLEACAKVDRITEDNAPGTIDALCEAKYAAASAVEGLIAHMAGDIADDDWAERILARLLVSGVVTEEQVREAAR